MGSLQCTTAAYSDCKQMHAQRIYGYTTMRNARHEVPLSIDLVSGRRRGGNYACCSDGDR